MSSDLPELLALALDEHRAFAYSEYRTGRPGWSCPNCRVDEYAPSRVAAEQSAARHIGLALAEEVCHWLDAEATVLELHRATSRSQRAAEAIRRLGADITTAVTSHGRS